MPENLLTGFRTFVKENGFELTDRIAVKLLVNEALQPSLIEYKTYICAEILADSRLLLSRF